MNLKWYGKDFNYLYYLFLVGGISLSGIIFVLKGRVIFINFVWFFYICMESEEFEWGY